MIIISYQTEFRSSNWVTLVYPESAQDHWLDRLRLQHIPFALSPLHDKDKYVVEIEQENDPDNLFCTVEGLKKPHYHLLLKFDTLKSLSQVKCILSEVLGEDGVIQPFVCHSCRQMVRYFAHLDDPEKYPYDFMQIQTYGLPLKDFLSFTPSESKQIFKNIMLWIRDSNCLEYTDLWDHALNFESDWCDVLSDHSCFILNIKADLASRRGKLEKSIENQKIIEEYRQMLEKNKEK